MIRSASGSSTQFTECNLSLGILDRAGYCTGVSGITGMASTNYAGSYATDRLCFDLMRNLPSPFDARYGVQEFRVV